MTASSGKHQTEGGDLCMGSMRERSTNTHRGTNKRERTVEVKGSLNLAHLCRIVRVPSKQHHVFERE